ncbi:MAG: sulfur carrier protein ThiS adenylyltransferase ThiF [Candidatus Mcinerneyibacterium aminivorans]|uniref:Sulfur carrier protein ThiS adenylyltransferase ThiF n=1 Tax=Candidatus Mcinerneyibacterium aminivorans TaxID=2703815 RepID=A0A5D0MK89_9BACT|nr:MAG: sulfur carrier protein ThiS adenylyltransferase ThiF [Candidatus Mcinerneyibacterium aminivorans]
MRIYINEREKKIREDVSLFELKEIIKPNADIVIYNGFPVNEDRKLKENDSVVFIEKGKIPSQKQLESLLVSRHTPGVHNRIKKAVVGIAGAGGLGSNVAISLTRMGLGKLIIVDYDVVEPSNLNRQQYFINQIGMLKVKALQDTLKKINPFVEIETYSEKIEESNIDKFFKNCDVIVEAFDKAEEKQMLINYILNNTEKYIVAGSGMAGYGPNNNIVTRKIGKLFICGDGESEAKPGKGLMAPRVGICANHQANQVVRILLNEQKEDD